MSKSRVVPHYPFANPARHKEGREFTHREMEQMYEHLVRYIEELRTETDNKIQNLQNQIDLHHP